MSVDPAHRVFVSYIDKSREFYLAQDFGNPYRWAANTTAPFCTPARPLTASRVGLVTTASVLEGDPDPDDVPPGVAYAVLLDPVPQSLYTMNRSWDKEATHTDDLDSFFPIHRLQEAVNAGRIGSIAGRFYGAPTEYSQRRTNDQDAPAILEWMREDGVDLALLVAL